MTIVKKFDILVYRFAIDNELQLKGRCFPVPRVYVKGRPGESSKNDVSLNLHFNRCHTYHL